MHGGSNPLRGLETLTDEIFDPGKRTYIKAGLVEQLTDGAIGALLDSAACVESPLSQIGVLAVGGAVSRIDPDATAFAHRTADWLINIPRCGRRRTTPKRRSHGLGAPTPRSSRMSPAAPT